MGDAGAERAQGSEATRPRELFVARARRLGDRQLLRQLELATLSPERGEPEGHDQDAAHDDARDEAALDAELAITFALFARSAMRRLPLPSNFSFR